MVAAAPGDTKSEFLRVLQLSGLDGESMTDDQRDALINIAENSGLDPGDAEDMVDEYLEEIDRKQIADITKTKAKPQPRLVGMERVRLRGRPRSRWWKSRSRPLLQARGPFAPTGTKTISNYSNSLGGQMFLIPSGEFIMGNPFPDAPPNETPHFRVTVTRFYMSRFPITNAHYEAFDPLHKSKRASATGDRHPVVYVSSLDAMKFCHGLASVSAENIGCRRKRMGIRRQGNRWTQISLGQFRKAWRSRQFCRQKYLLRLE